MMTTRKMRSHAKTSPMVGYTTKPTVSVLHQFARILIRISSVTMAMSSTRSRSASASLKQSSKSSLKSHVTRATETAIAVMAADAVVVGDAVAAEVAAAAELKHPPRWQQCHDIM